MPTDEELRDESARLREAALSAHMAGFAAALRSRDIEVSPRDQSDGLHALALIDIGDVTEVKHALRTALKVRRRDERTFAHLFDRMWRKAGVDEQEAGAPMAEVRPPAGFEIRRAATATGSGEIPESLSRESTAGYSPDAQLRRKRFDECSAQDLAAMQRQLRRLARRIAARPSRRLVPGPRGNVIDLRRSLRRSLSSGGDLIELARRRRAIERPRLVVLCDTSGSMDAYARFLLAFVVALERVASRSEAFAFNTTLTRLTGWITPADLLGTLERLARGVPDWSGGTRIGVSLMEFADTWLARVIDAKTTVLILSDGLDRGDTALLEEALARIRRRARRIIWLNPLAGDPGYRPEARGMKAALPYIDHLAPAHDVAALEALLPLLSA